MKVIRSISEMQQYSLEQRNQGKTISLVPTMGFLHEGHLFLIKKAKEKGEIVVVSIFVNPTQFGPKEDFKTYPRDEKGDFEKLYAVGIDVAFLPIPEEMYPEGFQTTIHLSQVSKGLCGKSRPKHFDGVATVVLKLFNLVQPHFAIFGEKDYQQLALIRQMQSDLHLPIEIIGVPTIRNSEGIALSSRNKYLNKKQQKEALVLSQALSEVQKLSKNGERNVSKLIQSAKKIIRTASSAVIDYLEIVDSKTLKPLKMIDRPARFLLAVKIGKTRLIDNGPINSPS